MEHENNSYKKMRNKKWLGFIKYRHNIKKGLY